ncbi:MAG TPA: CoA-acylating methylmalonate-semialdehyde dehydrogenase [Candidatus Acidoferrum sp.]|nr:CoA-acylating methylmalonate-semialdehyde dehydrogenase [Candidatus Acidoferrum sp.]
MKLVDVPDSVITCRNLIGGEWSSPSAPHLDVRSPYTGAVIGRVPLSPAAEVARAAEAAARAAGEWRRVPIKERTQALFRYRELVLANLDRLAHRAASEAGKTLAEARAGVLKGVEVIEFALSLQNLDDGGALEVSRGVSCEARREPLGVVAGVTPFNFPAMVPMWLYPIAVTLGNAFVLKPSEKVPLTPQILGELMLAAGFPAGVFSIVNGTRETVEAVIDHPDVTALGFVGSTPAARAVYARATGAGKRALALGGAKNHLIVVPDADPEVAIPGVVDSFTGCAGQRCMAASLMVAVGEADRLIDGIVERARAIRLGQDMGALIDKAAVERIRGAIGKAASDGADVRLDGREGAPPSGYERGHWMAPSVIDRADPAWECATLELFGPVLTIVRVKTLDQALALSERNPYGNATSVFTTNGAVARYVAERAQSGMVGVNIGVPVPREPFSFGGTKASRFGAGDITGRGGVELWTHLKKITTKWAVQPDATWMG